jgi:acetolactate synthase-1/2/3 large subunit
MVRSADSVMEGSSALRLETQTMTGADRLCEALLVNGVDVCFASPGTSAMHVVAALDRQPRMRCVLGLVEGVVTGAADGYGRMRDRPAATLLDLGPGLANGLANLHNARRAHTPVINIVGEQATDHVALDSPLSCDIDSLARPMSRWVGRSRDVERIEQDVARAFAQSMAPGVATLIVPADVTWTEHTFTYAVVPAAPPKREPLQPAAIRRVAQALRLRRKVVLLLTGAALREQPLKLAAAIARKTGARIFAQDSNGRIARGRGRVPIQRLHLTHESGGRQLEGAEMLVLIGTKEPVVCFAAPNQKGRLAPAGCEIVELARPDQDLVQALDWLADEIGVSAREAVLLDGDAPDAGAPVPATGALSAAFINRVVAERLPEQAIVCDEALSSGGFFACSFTSAPHDYLQLTGGAIGIGIPLAAGAAVACPDRKVINLQADGSGMHNVQALWTLAREKLDVLTIVFANRSSATLSGEMRKIGVPVPGHTARRMLRFDDPAIDWVKLSESLGVPAVRADTVSGFSRALDMALSGRGPFLIEAVI